MCTNNVPGATRRRHVARLPRAVQRAAAGQTSTLLAFDCTITVRLTGLIVAKGQTYRAEIDASTATTPAKRRTITIVGT